mmetsp:Transcript_15510/g.39280  ORF Transcript_15510/g.39280 Transcript_15510/m.39280 type:complete len:89 (+) Transcript_15510:249-515(+)
MLLYLSLEAPLFFAIPPPLFVLSSPLYALFVTTIFFFMPFVAAVVWHLGPLLTASLWLTSPFLIPPFSSYLYLGGTRGELGEDVIGAM